MAGAALALTSAGCSGDASGTPTAASTSETSTATPTSTSGQVVPLRDLDPCALITPAEAHALGAPAAGTPDSLAMSRGCGWTVSGSHVFGIALFDSQGVDDLTLTGRRTAVTIVGRLAERVEENSGPGYCSVIFPVTDTSVAQADGVTLTDTAKACQVAEEVARVIAPKLP